jgi:peptidoglycan/xylan/chitin deacetylase (PgdA/CDA1 family)
MPDHTLNPDIANTIRLWLGVGDERMPEIERALSEYPERHFDGILDYRVISPFEGLVRRLTHKIVKFLKEQSRYPVLDFIKRLRQMRRRDLLEVAQCRFVLLDRRIRERCSLPPIDWDGKSAVICLSHDVDSIEDYRFIRDVAGMIRESRLTGVFNFLTHWGYAIGRDLLDELTGQGNEIGLHGFTHDIAIGVRPEERIRRELSRALDTLGVPVKGYRAPAFAVTPRLLRVLKELGFAYDSSMKTISCYGQAAETFYPYRFPGVGIWEIPLTIQDDRVFRDLNLSNEEGLGVIKELTRRVMDVGGVMVINNHPRLIARRTYYYRELLRWIASLDNVWVATTGQVVEFMERREDAASAPR